MPIVPVPDAEIPLFCQTCGGKMIHVPDEKENVFICSTSPRHQREVQPTLIVKVAILDHTRQVFLLTIPNAGRNGSDALSFPSVSLRYGELPEEAVHRAAWEQATIKLADSPLRSLGIFLQTFHKVLLVHGFLAQPPQAIYSPSRRPQPEGSSRITRSFAGVDQDALSTDGDRQLFGAARRMLGVR